MRSRKENDEKEEKIDREVKKLNILKIEEKILLLEDDFISYGLMNDVFRYLINQMKKELKKCHEQTTR